MPIYITNNSMSYLSLGISLIALSFYLYFRLTFINTSPYNFSRDTIFGEIKYGEDFPYKSSLRSNISIFWTAVSSALFIYLKFFTSPVSISIVYPALYAALILLSMLYAVFYKRTAP